MKLVVLGSGTSVPHPTRSSAAFWLETTSGSLLLDISATAPHRMAEEKLPWPELDAIWISHFHLDHLGGIAPFLFGTKWAPQTQERRKRLRIFGGEGVVKLIQGFDEAGNYKLLDQTFPIEVLEIGSQQEFEILPNITARTFSTPHTGESLAIRITESDGTSLIYTSDTGISSELIEFCRNTSLLLLECSFYKNKPIQKHLELADAMEIARACKPQRLILTHFYPEWDDIDLIVEAKKYWQGDVIGACDGLRIDV
jgi:ribonuclease BN (tRNA processing enzyme)